MVRIVICFPAAMERIFVPHLTRLRREGSPPFADPEPKGYNRALDSKQ
jgi:hypothetical protein